METVYSTAAGRPQVLRRAADQRTSFALYRAGAVVVPDGVEYTLFDSDDNVLRTDAAILVDGVASVDLVAADLPATLAYGQGYYETWEADLGAVEGTRIYRRPITLGRFELAPPLGEAELVAGSYPDLLAQAGTAFGADLLGPILDEAWVAVLRHVWAKGAPGTVLADSGDLYAWYRELALARIFAALYAADPVDRWRDLRDDHRRMEVDARTGLRVSIDADDSGGADDTGLVAVGRPVHVNGAAHRSWRSARRGRW